METRSQLLCLASYWLDHDPKKVLYNKLPNKLPFRTSSPPQPSGASCPHPSLSWRVTVLATASGCKPEAPRLLSPAAEVTVETEPCLAEAEVTWVVVYTTHICALTRACGDREQPQALHQLSYLPSLGLFLLFLNIYLSIYLLFSGGAWGACGGQRTTCESQFLPSTMWVSGTLGCQAWRQVSLPTKQPSLCPQPPSIPPDIMCAWLREHMS